MMEICFGGYRVICYNKEVLPPVSLIHSMQEDAELESGSHARVTYKWKPHNQNKDSLRSYRVMNWPVK